MHHDYAPKGVKFYYIYKSLAHPERNNYVTPYTVEERLQHIAIAKTQMKTKVEWICDTITNDVKHALGDAPNSEFIIGPAGRVVRKRRWSDPAQLRMDLEELVGPVKKPTQIADLDVQRMEPPQQAAKGVVPRLQLPERMTPLLIEPSFSESKSAYYVKLRAEADHSLLHGGHGKLYLGFFLDPLYQVHWNNRAGNIAYSIEGPEGVSITPAHGQGPQVEQPADSDPREFLIDIGVPEGAEVAVRDVHFSVTVRYMACDDAETFCMPVSQTYQVMLQRDRDGGSRRGSGRGRGGPGAFAGNSARPGTAARMRERILRFDHDQDGKIDLQDVPKRMQTFLSRTDRNKDGFLDEKELKNLRMPRK